MIKIELKPGSDFRHMLSFALGGYFITQLIYEIVLRPPYPFLMALLLLVPFFVNLLLVWTLLGKRLYRPKGLALRVLLGISCAILTAFLTAVLFFSVVEMSDSFRYGESQLGELNRGFTTVLFYSFFGLIYSLPGILVFGTLLGVSAHRRVQARPTLSESPGSCD